METNTNFNELEPCSLATNGTQELEQMRSQLNMLKKKLDNQEIVNDLMLRQTFRQKMSFGQKYSNVALFILLPFVAIAFTSMHYTIGFSWPLIGFTILMMVAATVNDYRLTHNNDELFEGDMLTAAQQLVEKNRQLTISKNVGLAVCAVWLAWLFYELFTMGELPGVHGSSEYLSGYRIGLAICMGIGGIIGGAIGIGIYQKIKRNNQEVIDQINDLTK